MKFPVHRLIRSTFVLALSCLCSPVATLADPPDASGSRPAPNDATRPDPVRDFRTLFRYQGQADGITLVGFDFEGLFRAFRDGRRFRVDEFPLTASRRVSLELEPFTITTDATRFVIGTLDEPDRPFDFDPSSIALFRGRVVDSPISDVFLAVSPRRVAGHVAVSSSERFEIARGTDVTAGGMNTMRVFQPEASPSARSLDVPLCGVEDQPTGKAFRSTPREAHSRTGIRAGGANPLTPFTRRIRLAVETDYEYFELFNDLTDAADYVVVLFAAVNHIYLRDVNAYYELTFVRLWDNPADLFNDPDPLVPFRDYWNTNMGAVTRDVAHFASGRKNLPYGGVAYIGALCGAFGYGVTGYLSGSFSDPSVPGVGNYDPKVVAHELGHNCFAFHTHDYGIDTCNNFDGPPQRGTIMSYCSQTYSGGNANDENYFHSFVQSEMEFYLQNDASCVINDCNRNGVPDATDIALGDSLDTNANGIPDECEDCDGDGILDPAEIAAGSLDLNGNGIPDECEPDCNGNGVPDDRDILLGTSLDAYGNNIPDECEDDCDGNSVSDYTQIQLNMALDRNRNRILDSCEDCNNNSIVDLEELEGSWNVWAASLNADGAIREFHAEVGVRMSLSDTGHVFNGLDLLISPTRRIFVASSFTDSVIEFDRLGTYVADFVSSGSGGLDFPAGLAFMPGGDLLVSSRNTNSVIRYNGTTGALVGTFVASNSGGLSSPYGLTYGPNGNLFVVSSGNNQVLEYHGATGAFVREFVSSAANGTLSGPRGLVFKPDGNLLVTSFNSNQVLQYQAGTGAFLGQFNVGGTAAALTMDRPWGIRIGPDGNVYVARHDESLLASRDGSDPGRLHLNATRIYIFNVNNGWFIRSFVTGNDTGMTGTTGFDFMPGDALDCNRNFVLDECDILNGTSQDENGDNIPDECACLEPGPPAPEPDPVLRNRYLAFSPTAVGPGAALRVTFDSLEGFPGSNGQVRWVGPATTFSDIGGHPAFHAAPLQCTPFHADWSAIPVLHVHGDGIIPGSTYTIEVVTNCGGESGQPIQVLTGKWGDVVDPFGGGSQPSFSDVNTIVQSFQDLPGAASKTRAKLTPGLLVPGNNVSFADVNACVTAFQGAPYPYAGPSSCP